MTSKHLASSLAVVLLWVAAATYAADERNSQQGNERPDLQEKPWKTTQRQPALEGAFRCDAGWFVLRANLSGPSQGIFRVEVKEEPFVKRGVVYRQLTYKGYGTVTSESGIIYKGWAFSTGFDGDNGPKYLFFSDPEYFLLSFRNHPQNLWKPVGPCIPEDLLESQQ